MCIIVNNSQETKSFTIDNYNAVDVIPNSISFLYSYSNWKITTNTDIVYDFRFGDTITAKANNVLFNFTDYGSYLVLVIKE